MKGIAKPQLQIIAYIANEDIGFVHVGQTASIKIDAFPFTKYGTINGRLVDIAKDAIPKTDIFKSEADPASSIAANTGTADGEPTRNLVYPVTIEFSQNWISANGKQVVLSPGMGVTAEIKTGNRRIIGYIFTPVIEVASDAMHER